MPKRMAATKNAQGTALAATESTSALSMGRPEMVENTTITIKPEPTIRMGISTAQKKPMIDCL